MNIFCIGDIIGKPGREAVIELLPKIKEEFQIECVIANAENIAGGMGATPRLAKQLFQAGCDVITLGDHIWDRGEICDYLEDEPQILRPANLPEETTPGRGYNIIEIKSGKKIGVINLLGRVFMRYNVDCPFRKFKEIYDKLRRSADIIVVDFHAEATSEKNAMGHMADGAAVIIFGTHTHIQTADERILPKGSGYITDLGMSGPYDSVIGQNKEAIIKRFLTSIPVRFEVATGDVRVCGAVFSVDDHLKKVTKITRIQRGSL